VHDSSEERLEQKDYALWKAPTCNIHATGHNIMFRYDPYKKKNDRKHTESCFTYTHI
jgi:hypothetical protein